MTAPISRLHTFVLVTASLAGSAGAVVIADTTFDSNLPGLTFDATAGGNTAGYGTTGPNGTRALDLIDVAATTNAAIARYTPPSSNPFNTSAAGQSEFRLSFDFAVNNLSAGANSNSIPRIILRNTNNAQSLTFGVGRSTAGDLVVYAAKGDAVVPGTAGALSYTLATYDATTISNNTTGGYIRFAISLTHGDTAINVLATRGAEVLMNGSITGYSALGLSNTNTTFIMATGATGTGDMFVDNLTMLAVPEPSSAVLCASAVGMLVLRRNRRR